jgi:hypothetical protein
MDFTNLLSVSMKSDVALSVLTTIVKEASIEFYSELEGKILCFPLDLGYLYLYEDGTTHKSNYNPVEYCDNLDRGVFSKKEINDIRLETEFLRS